MKQTSKVAPAAEKVEQSSDNGIKRIKLKKEITEKKKFSNNLDYDWTVTDENGKGIKYFIYYCVNLCIFMYVCNNVIMYVFVVRQIA